MTGKKVIFIHPDLGVGGAERLVVDAALSLKRNGYDVEFITSHHDKSHCFEETKNGTLPVRVVGGFIPRCFFGRFFAVFAYLRMIVCAFYVILYRQADLVFCDLVSACIPILKMKGLKVIFYCHFPDQLLSQKGGTLKTFYRKPLNWLEEKTTAQADKIYVNSSFTKSVFKQTFATIKTEPDILYPSINTDPFDRTEKNYNSTKDFIKKYGLTDDSVVLLSINRYERKKNVQLSIKALALLKNDLNEEQYSKVKLIIAGGYDNRVDENIRYYDELKKEAETNGVIDKVIFLKSPSDDDKIALLKNCHVLIYTPSNEHFGIVPLEAMYCSKPVVAVNNGGPTETVKDDETGFLRKANPEDFSKAVAVLVKDGNLRDDMGAKGRERFVKLFSFQAFSSTLNKAVSDMIAEF